MSQKVQTMKEKLVKLHSKLLLFKGNHPENEKTIHIYGRRIFVHHIVDEAFI